MKRIYLLIMTCFLFAGEQLLAYDFAVNDVNGNAIYYKYLGSDSVAVTYDKMLQSTYSGDIVIPSEVQNELTVYRVTSIGNYAFMGSSPSSVIIPKSITSIGRDAFYDCKNLTSIDIPESVTSIGESSFAYCKKLISIELSESISSVEKSTFLSCTGLTSVVLPNTITRIGASAFDGCNALSSLTIPDGVTSIGDHAFSCCWSLGTMVIPNSVTSIGDYAFNMVQNVAYNGSATGSPWGAKSVNGYVEDYLVYADSSKQNLLACYVTATNVVIPGSVTTIGPDAFAFCDSLPTVEIPNSVNSIEDRAFWSCNSMKSIVIPSSVTSIGNNVINFCRNLTSIVIDAGNATYDSRDHCNAIIHTASHTLLDGCKNTIIPNSITSIGGRAFFSCYDLTSITIPKGVSSIGVYAFNGCSALDTVVCKAVVPPAPEAGPFENISATAILFVPYESIEAYKTISEYANNFAEIKGFSEVEDITDSTATLKWLSDTAVVQYDITIYQDETPFAHYVVDGDGLVVSSQRFAPSIYQQQLDTTKSSTDYYVITLNGLTAGTDYNYDINGADDNNAPIYHEEGVFTTTNTEGFIDAIPSESKRAHKILHNGHFYILRDDKTYTLTGQEVK